MEIHALYDFAKQQNIDSIFKKQNTVSLSRMENCELEISGRHDPAIVHRARAVVDAVSAIAVADMLAVKYGTDWLGESR